MVKQDSNIPFRAYRARTGQVISMYKKNYYLQAILATVLAFAVTANASAQNPHKEKRKAKSEVQDSIRQLYEVTVTSHRQPRTIATSQTLSGTDLQALSTTSVDTG